MSNRQKRILRCVLASLYEGMSVGPSVRRSFGPSVGPPFFFSQLEQLWTNPGNYGQLLDNSGCIYSSTLGLVWRSNAQLGTKYRICSACLHTRLVSRATWACFFSYFYGSFPMLIFFKFSGPKALWLVTGTPRTTPFVAARCCYLKCIVDHRPDVL